MRLTKPRPELELSKIKRLVEAQGLKYDDIPLTAEYDMQGRILSIETRNTVLQNILTSEGFVTV